MTRQRRHTSVLKESGLDMLKETTVAGTSGALGAAAALHAATTANVKRATPTRKTQATFEIDSMFSLDRKLGQGKFGQVWLATDKKTGQQYALKFLSNEMSQDEQKEVKREIALLSAFSTADGCHPNIVCYYRDFSAIAKLGNQRKQLHEIIIQTEFIKGAELGQWIANWYAKHKVPPPGKIVRHIAQGLLRALAFAHEKKIYHLDIKPSNVMVRESTGDAVLIDFGLACRDLECEETVGYGTPGYMSPQYVENCLNDPSGGACTHTIREKTDIWAAGLTLLALVANKDAGEILQRQYEEKVFPALTLGKLVPEETEFLKSVKSVRSYFPDAPAPIYAFDLQVSDVIDQALTVDMRKRPSANKLLQLLDN